MAAPVKMIVEVSGTFFFEVEAADPQEAYDQVRLGLGRLREMHPTDATVHVPDKDGHNHGPGCGCGHPHG